MNPHTSSNLDFGSVRSKGEPSPKPAPRRPSARSLTQLQAFAGRSQRKSGVALPIPFVRDENSDAGPMLARVLRGDPKDNGTRGGRGGEVRLKLLLSMHCIAVKKPYDVTRAPMSWAQMLDLPKDSTNGARRIRDAMDWLEAHRLIRVESTRGTVPKCFLLSPIGDGKEYSRPTPAQRYILVPTAFWQNGWIVALSGTALAMWLVLADLQGGREDHDVWVTPAEARSRYRLSQDTFAKGITEVSDHDLVTVRRVPQGAEEWQHNRIRNSYRLHIDGLGQQPR